VLVQSANSDDTRQISERPGVNQPRVDVLVIVPHNGGAWQSRHMAMTRNPVLAYDRLITIAISIFT